MASEKEDTACTYAELLDRCAMLRAQALLNNQTIQAQQRAYNSYLHDLIQRLLQCPPNQVRTQLQQLLSQNPGGTARSD